MASKGRIIRVTKPEKGPPTLDSPRHRRKSKVSSETNWWDEEGPAQAQGITAALDWMFNQQRQSRLWLYARNSCLYSNLPFDSGGRSIRRPITNRDYNADRLRMNIVKSCVNTLTNRVGTLEPAMFWETDAGDYKLQRKAKDLTRFNNGVTAEAQTFRKMRRCFRDAAGIYGDGLLYVYAKGGKVCHERVPLYEIFIDEREGALAEPRSIHRLKNIAKSQLIALFPDAADEIASAGFMDPYNDSTSQTLADLVTVRSSWHLGDREDGSDGVFTISTDRGVLQTKTWRHPIFPFAKFTFCEREEGWFGTSLTEELAPMQMDVNRLCWVKQRNQHKMGGYKVWAHTGSAIVKNQINNDFGPVIVSDQIPQYMLPPALQPEYYQDLAVTIQRMYDISGVNQSSAQGETASHLKSGQAIRADQQVGNMRLAELAKGWQDFATDIGTLNVMVAQDMFEEGDTKSYKVRAPGRKTLDVIDWKDISLPSEDMSYFWLRVSVISSLPQDPTAKWDMVAEWMQEGVVDLDEGRGMLDLPDTARAANLFNAQRERLEQLLDDTVNDGTEIAPDDFDNAQLGAKMSLEYIARARRMKVPPENIDLLLAFNRACNAIITKAKNQQLAEAQALQAAQMPPPKALPAPKLARPQKAPVNVSLPFSAKPGPPGPAPAP